MAKQVSTRAGGELSVRLNSVVIHLMRRMRRVDDRQPVGRARLSALSVLVFGGARTMSQLAIDEGVTPATIHHVVQGLLDEGLAQKTGDPADRRKSVIEVSAKGRRLMLKARGARLAMLDEWLSTLSAADRDTIMRAVAILSRWSL